MLKILTCELLTVITLAFIVVWSYQILKPLFRGKEGVEDPVQYRRS